MDLSDEKSKYEYSEQQCRKYFKQLLAAVDYSM